MFFKRRRNADSIEEPVVRENNSAYAERKKLAKRVAKDWGDMGDLTPAPFEIRCECLRDECVEPITLSFVEYEDLRSTATHFAVVPSHEDDGLVVSRDVRFVVVERASTAAAPDQDLEA